MNKSFLNASTKIFLVKQELTVDQLEFAESEI